MKLKTLIALIAGAVYGLAQTPPQIPSTVELMQTRGAINTALAQIAPIACVGTPGNTTGAYGQQCQTTLGARYSCNNAAGCTVAADWVFSATATPTANAIPKAGAAGTLASGWLPFPGPSSLGGVESMDCSSVGLVQKINTDGTVSCAAGGSSTPSINTSYVKYEDDFTCSISTGAFPGCLAWVSNYSNGTIGMVPSEWPHLGILRIGGNSGTAGSFQYIGQQLSLIHI